MSTPVVGVLAMQGDVREHVRVLRELGAAATRVRRPPELAGVDALVIPGGESTTIDKLLRAFELQEPLKQRIKTGLPVFGSCAGMILLADRIVDGTPDQQTLGGIDMTVRRNAFGRQVQSFEADLDCTALGDGQPYHAVFIRAPWVEDVGPGVDVLATVAAGPAAGRIVAVRSGPLLATSFHPELTGDPRLHRLFLDVVKES
ncbi:MAG: pyridoxal 5'-phosphate synthase glutaminase subunit PdxT [Jiangellaceae bacterium]|nr:pyridoxal 5'-phosphate synthase glutaminase subunit PdxT [Jiangellaceae bacterium]